MRHVHGRLALLMMGVLFLALPACDEEDSGWIQPTEPGPTGAPSLTLTVSGEEQLPAGNLATLSVRLDNTGQAAADSAAVSVSLPEVITLDQAQTSLGAFDADARLWTLADLPADSAATLFLLVTVAANTVGERAGISAELIHAPEADDGAGAHDALFQFTVINHPPVARDDAYTVDEGGAFIIAAPGVLANDEDPDGAALTLQLEPVLQPTHGTMAFQADGSMAYAHDGSESVADSLQYVVIDAEAARDTATVHIAVTPVNDLPVLDAPASITIAEGEVFAPISLDALVSDADHALDQLQWQILGADALTVEVSADRVLTVTTPDQEWNGADTLIFRVRDPEGVPVNDDVQFIVTSINDAPVMSPLPNQSIVRGGTFLPIPLDNYVADVDHDDAELTWTVADQPPLLVSISPDRVLTVQPPDGTWTGTVVMTLRATDPEDDWDERQVQFTVTAE